MNGSFLVILLGIPGILVATTVHEFVRALASTVLGDNYPKSQGQVTLNPVKHFEPIGFLMMLYSGGFGWGRRFRRCRSLFRAPRFSLRPGCMIPAASRCICARWRCISACCTPCAAGR